MPWGRGWRHSASAKCDRLGAIGARAAQGRLQSVGAGTWRQSLSTSLFCARAGRGFFGGERLPPELDRGWSSYPLLRGHCPATPRAAAAIAPARRTRREWEERVRRNAQAASISHDEKHCGAATPRSCRRGSFTRRARRQRPVLFCPEARTKRAAGTFGLTSRDGGSAGRRDRGGRSH